MSGANKRVLYVGGLEDEVTADVVRAAFIPFGDIADVNLPVDNSTGKHRGFAFVEFEEPGDASEAFFNMNQAELCGRVLKVNFAKPMEKPEDKNKPVWETQADTYFTAQNAAAQDEDVAPDGPPRP